MLVVCFLRKKAMQETWKMTYSMIYCVNLPKKQIRSVEAVRGGDSPSSEKHFVEVQMGHLLPSDKKITLCWKVALRNFEIPSFC